MLGKQREVEESAVERARRGSEDGR
uniref:Uncharacterized protein n=1 Tax=Arundo donax TaxID=35708 RepID=A0A0A9S5Y5_ARUDO